MGLSFSKLSGASGYFTSGWGIDSDAASFISAAAITNPIQQSAVNYLVVEFKKANLWTKSLALYPFVGGTATTHKWNLKDPRDLDAAYRLSFFGGWTHSTNGILPDGTGYANTFLSTSVIGLNSGHLAFYSRTNSTAQSCEIGGGNPTPDSYTTLELKSVGYGGTTVFRYNNQVPVDQLLSLPDTSGFFVGSRTGGTTIKLFRNGSNIINGTAVSNATSVRPQFIAAYNNGTPILYSTKQCALASIGTGLTDTDAVNMSTIVQTFELMLGRAV